MFILLNISKNKNLIVKIFSNDSEIIQTLLDILTDTYNFKYDRIQKILCNIFFDEFLKIFSDLNLHELRILNNFKFTELNIAGLDKYPKSYYENILEILINFNFTYSQSLNNKKNYDDTDDRNLSKNLLLYIQLKFCIFRVLSE